MKPIKCQQGLIVSLPPPIIHFQVLVDVRTNPDLLVAYGKLSTNLDDYRIQNYLDFECSFILLHGLISLQCAW